MREADPNVNGTGLDAVGGSDSAPVSSAKGKKSFLDGLRNNSKAIALAASLGLAGSAGVVGAAGCSGAGMETDEKSENIGTVQQKIWKDPAAAPTCGQTGNNRSPFTVWKTPTDGVKFFASDNLSPGDLDLYYCTTADGGGSWSAEQLVDGTSVNKINVAGAHERSVVYAGGKLYTTSDRTGNYDVYQIGYDINTFKTTSAVGPDLPSGPGKLNSPGDEEYIQLSPDGTKLYVVSDLVGGRQTYVTDIGVWNLNTGTDKVTGLPATAHYGVAVWTEGGKNYIGLSVDYAACPKAGNGLDELCRWELADAKTALPLTKTNFDDIAGSVKVGSTGNEFTPSVDSKGNLEFVSDTGAGTNAKLKHKDPIVVIPPADAGADASDANDSSDASDADAGDAGSDAGDASDDGGSDAGDGGDAGADSGADAGGQGGAGGHGGSGGGGAPEGGSGGGNPQDGGKGGSPDVDAGDAGSDAAGDAAADTGASDSGPDAAPGCDVKAEVISGTCEVKSCAGGSVSMSTHGDCNYNYKPAGVSTATVLKISGNGNSSMNGSAFYPGEGVKARVVHPKGTDAKVVSIVYQVDNGSELELGLLGTDEETSVQKTADDRILTLTVAQDAVQAKLNGVAVQGFDYDNNGVDDNGIVSEGHAGKLSLKNAKNLTKPTSVPDGGPTVSPNPPGEGGGCGICSVPDGMGKTRNDLGAWAIAAGIALLAYRRRNGFVGVESNDEKVEK